MDYNTSVTLKYIGEGGDHHPAGRINTEGMLDTSQSPFQLIAPSKSTVLEVSRLFVPLNVVELKLLNFDAPWLNGALAVIDHYGFNAPYRTGYIEQLLMYSETILTFAYTVSKGRLRKFNNQMMSPEVFAHEALTFFCRYNTRIANIQRGQTSPFTTWGK